jgi:hypothetical protein
VRRDITQNLYMRQTNTNGYRSGQWARVTDVRYLARLHGPQGREPRPVFVVEFVDGATDLWPVDDPCAGYQFSGGTPGHDPYPKFTTGSEVD